MGGQEMTNSMNKPELETLSYKPASAPREAKEKTTLDIEPKTGAKNKESVCQPEQPKCKTCEGSGKGKLIGVKGGPNFFEPCPDCKKKSEPKPEQPNQQIMLIKTIQGLTTAILHDISKLPESVLKAKAREEIGKFERTTLYELQKEYE